MKRTIGLAYQVVLHASYRNGGSLHLASPIEHMSRCHASSAINDSLPIPPVLEEYQSKHLKIARKEAEIFWCNPDPDARLQRIKYHLKEAGNKNFAALDPTGKKTSDEAEQELLETVKYTHATIARTEYIMLPAQHKHEESLIRMRDACEKGHGIEGLEPGKTADEIKRVIYKVTGIKWDDIPVKSSQTYAEKYAGQAPSSAKKTSWQERTLESRAQPPIYLV